MSGLCWANILDCAGRNGDVPRSTLANAVLVLQHDPQFSADHLWYDEFLDRVLTIDGRLARPWRDDDDTRVTVYLQQTIGMLTVAESIVASAVRYVARQRRRHCVREHVRRERWDGTERLEHAFEDFWGAEPAPNQPSPYLRAASANFFLALIARIMRPGCQVDTMVIFEGAQGIGKSRALRVIGGDWYMLAAESVTSKDFFQALAGAWVVEIGEMDSFSKAERERTKLVISTPTDRYRPSYARNVRDFPRQCVFAGTTNHDDYGNDATGLRRFMPVRCGDIDIDGLGVARPQLFAEAVHYLDQGRAWWEAPQSEVAQADRQMVDVWTDAVTDYLVGKADVSLVEVLRDGLKIRESDMTRSHAIRVADILRHAGWDKRNARFSGKVSKRWFQPEEI